MMVATMPKFKLKFYQAWRMKGVFDERKQWTAYKLLDDTPVVTIWHTDLTGAPSEVVFDEETGRSVFRCYPDDWVRTYKGKEFLRIANECYDDRKLAEVILLVGIRNGDGVASEFYGAAIEDDLYYVKFTYVGKDGTVKGEFINKEKTNVQG